ncbi:MAG: hypothetical protein AB1611_11660 [bacterium]
MAIPLRRESEDSEIGAPYGLTRILNILQINRRSPQAFAESLPFSLNDTTAGSENELQAVVMGKKDDVDLPISIEESNYYQNIVKRIKAGETPRRIITELEKYLSDNREDVWENSWVRFPRSRLSHYANKTFNRDLLADKSNPSAGRRTDADRFILYRNGEEHIRIPVSYLLKLALADAVSSGPDFHLTVRATGERIMHHFLNDNTSPETFSFQAVLLNPRSGMGREIARETAKRFLLTQFLLMYANRSFQLVSTGQRALVYFAPHPPVRQRHLNDLISDAFYRELFMSPCLSGWDKGEAKYQYMILCHQVLSRSHLNTLVKLKDAGIITRNLVVLPNLSNISLANNGTHISLGSRKLTGLLGDAASGFGAREEKYFGDLVIKIAEHFLPLFVNAYSAAPYRLDFWDFHPERALGYLPHELDFTHLRMIWRRWKGKARLKIFGNPITPFGPKWLDVLISRIFELKGDFILDFRLIDYLVALMSTDQSPALDGRLGNDKRLKKDLADLGVFDTHMSIYLLYRLREFWAMGFSGFEGRHYSLFESLMDDLGQAAGLQTLITALAFHYILKGEITHDHIPDDPSVESERRQIFFGTAIGIPTFYVRKNTKNQFMMKILKKVQGIRLSHRYPNYLRVHNLEYRKALIEVIREDAPDLIELMELSGTLTDLERRIINPELYSAGGKLTRDILGEANAPTPMHLAGREFNLAAERYYRNTLRIRHVKEALSLLEEDVRKIETCAEDSAGSCGESLTAILGGKNPLEFLAAIQGDLISETASPDVLRKLIHLTLLTIHDDREKGRKEQQRQRTSV